MGFKFTNNATGKYLILKTNEDAKKFVSSLTEEQRKGFTTEIIPDEIALNKEASATTQNKFAKPPTPYQERHKMADDASESTIGKTINNAVVDMFPNATDYMLGTSNPSALTAFRKASGDALTYPFRMGYALIKKPFNYLLGKDQSVSETLGQTTEEGLENEPFIVNSVFDPVAVASYPVGGVGTKSLLFTHCS